MIKKLYFSILTIIIFLLFVIAQLTITVNASAKIDFNFTQENLHGGSGGGGGTIVVYFDAQHEDEIKNFASINESINALGAKYYINNLVMNSPSKDSDYNNIDNVIYMIDKLDKLAMKYTGNDRRKANNCVFGYIRGISKSYCDEGENGGHVGYIDSIVNKWTSTAGKIDKGFVNFVTSNEKVGEITFPEFFASFVQGSDDYNSYLYGAVDISFLNKRYKVPDPLGTGQSIDLLHMFAAMDGIYENTEHNAGVCKIAFESHTYQKDLLSWLGDLHQLTNAVNNDVYKEGKNFIDYNPAQGYIDFDVHTGGSGFSSEDLLADTDAFNIVKFFIDCEKNSIANAFLGYYNSINKNKATKGNRFYEFMYTVTLELERGNKSSILSDFRLQVCSGLNIDYDNGNYTHYNYYPYTDALYKGMDILNKNGTVPAYVRGKCAKLFCDYIIAMSGR